MINLRRALVGSKNLTLFVSGAVFANVAKKVWADPKSKTVCAKLVAKGMHLADGVNTVISNVKQEVEDVYAEAEDIYAKEKQDEAVGKIESVEAIDHDEE
ncbi:DUF6110 family protein [Atopobacter sp. AH10]|uniref:DUF6110 family protein n=1 Tax=Atopobacter sp. AH10 TaxID=2315861 RepID=UPI0011C37F74|nr:DUF6110 family protein [Atopobacter sp. AH10]